MTTNEQTTNKPATITVAWNSLRRRWEQVFPEDELGTSRTITMYLGGDGRYYSIPE